MPKIPYRVRPETAVLTRGFDPTLSVGAARPPVYRSSTFVFPSPEAAERAFGIVLGKIRPLGDDRPDLIYARLNHPNAEILEEQLVPLERGANSAAIFNSGMAAIFTVMLTFLERGGSIVYTQPLYGGTQHLIHQVIEPLGFEARGVPAGNTKALTEAIEKADNLSLVLIETPANPTLVMTDIAQAAAAIRKRHEAGIARNRQHSARPDLSASADSRRGPRALLGDQVPRRIQRPAGRRGVGGRSGIDPDADRDARAARQHFAGRRMLDARLAAIDGGAADESAEQERAANRRAVGQAPQVKRVIYPSLFTDAAQIQIRDAQTDYPGSLVSLEVEGGKTGAFEFLRRLKIAKNAVSLGGVETLVCHPMTTTHSELSAEEMSAAGITEALVRISVGTEHWRDLLEEFTRALA